MSQPIDQPHDRIFKSSLANIDIARDFLITHLPTAIANNIDLDSLEICQSSFVGKHMRLSQADVLCRATIKNNKSCYLYALIEHQSTDAWDMPIRMAEYQLAIIRSHLQANPGVRSLPVVVPMLFYNGIKSPYPRTLDILDLFENHELAKQTFARPARLIDLTVMSDDAIKQHGLIGPLEFVQKHARDTKFTKQDMQNFVQIINNFIVNAGPDKLAGNDNRVKEYLMGILHYLARFANIDDKQFFHQLATIEHIDQEQIMGTLARKLEEQGIQKGILQGIQQGILKGIAEGEVRGKAEGKFLGRLQGKLEVAQSMLAAGLNIDFILQMTGLQSEDLEQLK